MGLLTPGSLRQRLIALLLAVTVLTWGVSVYTVYVDARAEARAMFDAGLAQTARVILTLVRHEFLEGDLGAIELLDPAVAPTYQYESRIVTVLRDRDGALLLRSPRAPAFPLPASILAGDSGPRFENTVIEGTGWRVLAMRDGRSGATVQTAVTLEGRDRLARNLVWDSFGPLLATLPLVVALMLIAVGAGLAPLERLAGEVARRAPDRLDPIDPRHAPREVRPLFDAVNALLARLDEALARERRFTGDASHELRTPLAVLKTHAQLALRSPDAESRERALRAVLEGVDRCTHLVERLLTLARMDAGRASGFDRPLDLVPLAREVVSTATREAESRDTVMTLSAPEERCLVRGDSDSLRILLRNLVDNAIRYSGEHGRVEVIIEDDGDGVLLCVEDSGPGIPESERPRALERFKRIPGSGERGSGLGLSIVARVAELHGATLTLATARSGQGLRACVRFPAVSAAADSDAA